MTTLDTAPVPAPARPRRRPLRYLLGVPFTSLRPVEERRDRSRRLLGRDVGGGPVSRAAQVVHALLGAGVGLVGWFLVALAVPGTLRGPFYLLVDPGPYDHSWGGPNPIGAWAAHAWVWVATLPVTVAVLVGLAALHVRLTEHLLGGRRCRWVVPATGLLVVGAVFFVRAWVHQL